MSASRRPDRRLTRAWPFLAGVSAVLVASCGSSAEAFPGCDAVQRESRAADAAVHVLPGASPTYLSDPPTSGPHIPWAPPPVIDRQLALPEQVGVLETGGVLVQYRPDEISTDSAASIGSQLPPGAHLAPNADLARPVILTAFLTRLDCDGLDLAVIEDFTTQFRSEEPLG